MEIHSASESGRAFLVSIARSVPANQSQAVYTVPAGFWAKVITKPFTISNYGSVQVAGIVRGNANAAGVVTVQSETETILGPGHNISVVAGISGNSVASGSFLIIEYKSQ